MCNEFVADLTGLDIQKKPEEGMSLLKAWILFFSFLFPTFSLTSDFFHSSPTAGDVKFNSPRSRKCRRRHSKATGDIFYQARHTMAAR